MRHACLLGVLVLAGCPSKKDAEQEFQEAVHKMTEFKDMICACKDKACADKVQEAMTKWSMEMAKKADTTRRFQPTEQQIKQMTEVGTMYGECMTKAMGMGIEPEPVRDDVPPASTSHNADQLLREARAWATAKQPEHRVATAQINYVEADGTLDNTYGELDVTFGRPSRKADDPKRKIGAPVPTRPDLEDCFQLTWKPSGGWSRTTFGCGEAFDLVNRCSVTQIWKRALERKAPAEGLASIALLRSSDGFAWSFTIRDEPREIDIRETFVDDCPLAVEK